MSLLLENNEIKLIRVLDHKKSVSGKPKVYRYDFLCVKPMEHSYVIMEHPDVDGLVIVAHPIYVALCHCGTPYL